MDNQSKRLLFIVNKIDMHVITSVFLLFCLYHWISRHVNTIWPLFVQCSYQRRSTFDVQFLFSTEDFGNAPWRCPSELSFGITLPKLDVWCLKRIFLQRTLEMPSEMPLGIALPKLGCGDIGLSNFQNVSIDLSENDLLSLIYILPYCLQS